MTLCEWLGIEETEESESLLEALAVAHRTAASVNQNASSMAVRLASLCGVPFESAVASGLLTFGAKHAPIADARRFIYQTPPSRQDEQIERGDKIPGWGNSFFKDSIDPAFQEIERYLQNYHPSHLGILDAIGQKILERGGKKLYPNAAAFTAVTADILGIVPGVEVLLVLGFRLPVWAAQYVSAA